MMLGVLPDTVLGAPTAYATSVRLLLRVVLVALAAAGVIAATGCSQFNQALGQQEAMVSFKSGTPDSERLAVRAACGKLPNVTAVPLPSGVPQAVSLSQVVYRVDHASNADKARLQVCLSKYPSVAGMTFQDSSDIGG
jgi:hypothetical protein